jgi:hypothetical protein
MAAMTLFSRGLIPRQSSPQFPKPTIIGPILWAVAWIATAIAVATMVAIGIAALVDVARAGERTHYYDRQGHSIGSSEEFSRGTRLYDERGHSAGTVEPDDRGATFYDARGIKRGRVDR